MHKGHTTHYTRFQVRCVRIATAYRRFNLNTVRRVLSLVLRLCDFAVEIIWDLNFAV